MEISRRISSVWKPSAIGLRQFSSTATSYTEGGGNTTLHFDTNGSTGSDEMIIILTGTGLGLTVADFVL